MFSTRQGQRSPRSAPHPARATIARSNVEVDIATYASVLRKKFPDVARYVKVPVNIGNYFDDYDLATEGSDFLSAVLETMSKENGHPVVEGKSRCRASPHHNLFTSTCFHHCNQNTPRNTGNLRNSLLTFDILFHHNFSCTRFMRPPSPPKHVPRHLFSTFFTSYIPLTSQFPLHLTSYLFPYGTLTKCHVPRELFVHPQRHATVLLLSLNCTDNDTSSFQLNMPRRPAQNVLTTANMTACTVSPPQCPTHLPLTPALRLSRCPTTTMKASRLTIALSPLQTQLVATGSPSARPSRH